MIPSFPLSLECFKLFVCIYDLSNRKKLKSQTPKDILYTSYKFENNVFF